jgi:hypothetical protein
VRLMNGRHAKGANSGAPRMLPTQPGAGWHPAGIGQSALVLCAPGCGAGSGAGPGEPADGLHSGARHSAPQPSAQRGPKLIPITARNPHISVRGNEPVAFYFLRVLPPQPGPETDPHLAGSCRDQPLSRL